ncbi:hypothetical protein ACIRG5_30040 [Lentzea sp. NPDC102401]|uniref:hypothetical protein n=1 Tax=Lentzea sp. NPDC102401 TaxID=3364128 RepID=UPI0038055B12
MNPEAVAAYIAEKMSPTESKPFLLARVVTDQLREHPVDTGTPNWQDNVNLSIESAFEADLQWVDPDGLAEPMLTALTWGYGAGFPEEEWIAVASALVGRELGRADVTRVLYQLGRYVIQDSEVGYAVYRIAHQTLADHLRPPFRPDERKPFDLMAVRVAAALTERYALLLDSGLPPTQPRYLLKYVWRHCAAAGQEGLDGLRSLSGRSPLLIPDLALASALVAEMFTRVHRPADAIEPLLSAVELYEVLAKSGDHAHAADRANALDRLGLLHRDVGAPLQAVDYGLRAVLAYRELVETGSVAVTATDTLTKTLASLHERPEVGLAQLEPLRKPLYASGALSKARAAGGHHTYLSHLGDALVHLSDHYSSAGKPLDGHGCAEEAVATVRGLRTSQGYLPLRAKAFSTLSRRCVEIGQLEEAVRVARSAAVVYGRLASANTAYRTDLAKVLSELSATYQDLGDAHSALRYARRAADIQQQLADDDSTYRPQHAATLINLSKAQVSNNKQGVRPAQEAVRILTALAVENPVHRPSLAAALLHLSSCYPTENRRGLRAAQDAVMQYLDLATENVVFVPSLGDALISLERYDSPDLVAAAWDQALGEFHGDHAATLLLRRCTAAEPGALHTIPWFLAALNNATSHPLVAQLHEVARRHHDIGRDSWERRWREHAREPAPAWLTVDRTLLREAVEWVFTPTYVTEKQYLADHPRLLKAEADIAVAEAALQVDEQEAERLQAVRASANVVGVMAAYEPVLLAGLVDTFIAAPVEVQRQLLAEHRDQLRSPEAQSLIGSRSQADSRVLAERAMSLIVLSEDEELLDLAFQALFLPAEFPRVMHELALSPEITGEALGSMAVCGLSSAMTENEQSIMACYLVVAIILSGGENDAWRVVDATNGKERALWRSLIPEIAHVHPEIERMRDWLGVG